jgi:hypothetical protein
MVLFSNNYIFQKILLFYKINYIISIYNFLISLYNFMWNIFSEHSDINNGGLANEFI